MKPANRIEIRHLCDCADMAEPPGEDGTEHILRIDGTDFPWAITEKGPVVTKLDEGWYTVAVEMFAREVDAVGVEIHAPPRTNENAKLREDVEALLAVATLYVDSFSDDELMTLPERMRLQEIEDILARRGRRY